MFATYVLLTAAVLCLWVPVDERAPAWRRFPWLLPFAASLVAAWFSGIVAPLGLLWVAAFAAATWRFGQHATTRLSRRLAAAAIILLSAGLMSHQLPGFNNPRVIDALRFSPDAIPYRLHLNYDKTVVGLFILGFCHARIARLAQWRTMLAGAAPAAGILIAALMLLSMVFGYVRFDPKLPPMAGLWLWVNLCFTCIAEEALFRGFVQAQLQRAWAGRRHGAWHALLVAAVLFGLAHAGGGPTYVALATLAGVGYGWAYFRTGCIEASLLTHFTLNTVHFFAFSYPALQGLV